MSMNPEIKTQWLQALRSGEYTQGQGCLATVDDEGTSYCCLGVLSNLAEKAGVTRSLQVGDKLYYARPDALEDSDIPGECQYLPEEVREWAGIDAWNPPVKVNGKDVYVSSMNDMGDGFEKIADFIEEYF